MAKNFKLYLSVLIVLTGAVVSFSVFAQDGSVDEAGITFPVAELGSCGDKDECRDYCNEPGNMPSCIAFAKKHGLMNEDEASKAERFAERVVRGEGPGGCRGPRECEAFCSQVQNIETCLAFAEEHGFEDEHVNDAKKIRAYISGGGQMPGGCNSKESCEAYCGDFNHAEECFAFAEQAGLTIARGAEKIPPGQFQRFIQAVKNNETPGGCKSKNECETYCRDSSRFEECVAFGEKMGFVRPEQAELMRKTGGKGPGGCNSEESCRTYCNDASHHDECFKFAEEHGLIPKEELERARDGFIRMRQGLEHAPPEVAACLKSVLGENIITDIQSGKLTPGPEIGERVRACFEKFGKNAAPQAAFSDAPPEVLACLKEKFGDRFDRIRTGQVAPTPEMADTFRVCFQNVQFEKQGLEGPAAAPPPGIQNFLRSAPPAVQVCLKEKLGGTFEQLQTGRTPITPELGERIKSCFESFRPDQAIEKPGFVPPGTGIVPGAPPNFSNLPPEVLACVKEVIGVNPLELGSDARNIPEISEKVKLCYEKLRSNVAPPGTAVAPGVVCIQVITPAYDPVSGECRDFPTPCDVPAGWQRGCPSGNTSPPPPITSVSPSLIEMKLEADDAGFYPSSVITVPKGVKVRLTFFVRTERVYYGGLDFRSSRFRTDPAKPGSSVTVEFLADQSFDFISYWPLSDAQKAVGKVVVQ